MPELPEVETIKRQLARAVVGKTIEKVEVLEPKMFVGDPAKIQGKKILAISRQAKVLRIILEGNTAVFIHFKLNGQLFLDDGSKESDSRFTRVILHLSGGVNLRFNDSRKFAWMKVVENLTEEGAGAVEPFKDNFTLDNFRKILSKTRKPVKLALMDQEKIGGIGNIYANESLFAARVKPFKPANKLSDAETKRLFEAVLQILKKAIDCGGSSGKDEWYRQLDGNPGCYQEHFLVYQRDGQVCPANCGGRIARKKQSGRSTFYCPKCQK